LKDIQSSENQKSLEGIDSDHRKEKSNEDSKGRRTSNIININQIVTSKETLMNFMSQQNMILLKNNDKI
jgi:hypothetical protein